MRRRINGRCVHLVSGAHCAGGGLRSPSRHALRFPARNPHDGSNGSRRSPDDRERRAGDVADGERRRGDRAGDQPDSATHQRAAGAWCSAVRATMAATALSRRGCCARSAIKCASPPSTPLDQLRGDAAQAAAAWPCPVTSALDCSFDGIDLVIDALFGTGLARDLDSNAQRARPPPEPLAARKRPERRRRRYSKRRRRHDRRGARRGGGGRRDGHLLSREDRPSAVAGPSALRRAHLHAYRHSTFARSIRSPLRLSSTCRSSGAPRCPCRKSRATNIRAAMRWSSRAAPPSQARRGFRRLRPCAPARVS